jgi:hypothetical protein
MPRLDLGPRPDSAEYELEREEWSLEAFDRVAFVHRALDLLRPPKTKVVICPGRHLRVEAGRAWGEGPGQRWALVSVPPRASRRALALAIAELMGPDARPWALDVLLSAP